MPSLRVDTVATIDAGGGRAHSLVTWGRYVAWTAGAAGPDEDPNEILVHDLDSKQTRVVARTRFPRGTIPRVRGSGESLVFLDMSRVPTDSDAGSDWHMYEVSISTGKQRRLLSSTGKADREDPPIPSIAWPWVVWFRPAGDAYTLQSLDLREARERTVARSPAGGQLSLDNETLTAYYDDDNGANGRDVFAVPVDGSAPPRRVTTSGKADFPLARNGAVAWQEPPGGRSEALLYKAASTDTVHRVSTPSSTWPEAGRNPFPGRGFVVWLMGSQLLVRAASGQSPPTVLEERHASIPARWWVEADRVAWATLTGVGTANERSVIHVAHVRT